MLAVLAVLLYEIRIALLPFVFAIAVAFVTDPWIKSLQRRLGSPRWPVAAGFFLLILALLGGAGYWIGTTAVSDLMSVVARAPDILRHFLTEILGNKGITVFGETYTPDKAVKALGAAMSGVVGFSAVKGVAAIAGSILFGTILTLVLMPYFMISAPRLAAGAIWLLPPERRRSVEDLLPEIVPMLRRYLIGLCVVVFYTAVVAWIGFGLIFHLPHAILLSITVGVLELIPVIGPFASGTIVAIIAVQQGGNLVGSTPVRLRDGTAAVDRQCRRANGFGRSRENSPRRRDYLVCLRGDPVWGGRSAAGGPGRGLRQDYA